MSGPFQGGSETPKVAVVVVSYNGRVDLLRCLGSLARHVRLPLEVVVVDNASSDGSARAARAAHPAAVVLDSATNRGFSAANNEGVRQTTAPYLLVLNPDAEVTPGAVETLSGILDRRPEIGLVGPRTRSLDGTIQVSFGPDLTPLSEWRQRRLVRGVLLRRPDILAEVEARASREHDIPWLSASCFLARREAFLAVGGFDEGFFLYEEDADICRRLRQAGWRVLFTPAAEVRHALGTSMATAPGAAREAYDQSHLLYYRKYNGPAWTALLRLYQRLFSLVRAKGSC